MTRIHVPIPLRWSDFDAYAHVNNAEMLRLLEEARIQAFWRPDEGVAGSATAVLDARPGAEVISLIARQEIEYLAIPTDPIRAAAYFTIALHGRPSPAGLSARAAEELGKLRLDEGDTAAARRLAAQLLAQRPER